MNDEYEIASLVVVVMMFPSIPHNLALEALDGNWEHLENKMPLTKLEFLNGINFLLNSTFIQFNNKFYRQKKGLSMDFCSSPVFSDLVMDHLEKVSLNKLKSSLVLSHDNNFFSSCEKAKRMQITCYFL